MGNIKRDIKETYLGLVEFIKEKWSDFSQFLKEAWPFLILLLIILMGIWWYADPPPPKRIVMATGQYGGFNEDLGKKYAAFFEKNGITLELRQTNGTQENIELLSDRRSLVQAAFGQAGAFNSQEFFEIQSLGAISYQPIWFFYRGDRLKEDDFQEFLTRSNYFLNSKISIGVNGSGTYIQAMQILKANGLQESDNFVRLTGFKSVEALKRGDIDAMFICDVYESPNIQKLIEDPNIHLATFPRAEAYTHLFPYMQILSVPQGAFSLRRNLPVKDVKLLAAAVNLLIDASMHPALQFLFLEAAREIGENPTFFSGHSEFPVLVNFGFPESPVSMRYRKNGSPFLMTYLPFWLAEMVNRLIYMMLPLCAFAYPLLLTLPSYRYKRMRRKIDGLYQTLKAYEQELTINFQQDAKYEYLKKLDLLEYRTIRLDIPKSLSNDYYALRASIDYVRNCLNRGVHPYQAQSSP